MNKKNTPQPLSEKVLSHDFQDTLREVSYLNVMGKLKILSSLCSAADAGREALPAAKFIIGLLRDDARKQEGGSK